MSSTLSKRLDQNSNVNIIRALEFSNNLQLANNIISGISGEVSRFGSPKSLNITCRLFGSYSSIDKHSQIINSINQFKNNKKSWRINMAKKHTHKKNKAVEGTKKRTQKRVFTLANDKKQFSDFENPEFDLGSLKDLDQYFDLNGLGDVFKDFEGFLSDPNEIVSLKASNDVKRAFKRASKKNLRGSQNDRYS